MYVTVEAHLDEGEEGRGENLRRCRELRQRWREADREVAAFMVGGVARMSRTQMSQYASLHAHITSRVSQPWTDSIVA